ncbi:preprotein translocase subunit SecE [Lacrimispora sp. NSJ-141]|uniref:Protein translocase subunit SecE n=2 Tax=Lachnospiraceae TaxID=186803 RepID=A0A7G9G1W2_9FIRM|nr:MULTISPECIES: preprotein translocase subunit SecE [Lachnospiraceae]MCD2493378.1 preprotein translocase subunit SecE [Lientehia hominis]QNM04794.1 preprotein translocase subunit SecE [Qiania dongpingensis]
MEESAKKKKSLFKNLKAEFKKIIWPDKKSFTRQTVAVVLTSVFLGAVIALLDLVIKFGINFVI